MEEFKNRLKEALEKREMRPVDLSERTGISRSVISSYLAGRWKAKQDNLYLISKAMNIDPAWLMGYDISMDGTPTKKHKESPAPKGTHKPQFKKVPMMGYAAAGQPLEDINQDINFFDVENKYDVDFCITVRGDSMINANINDGDIIFIKSMSEVPNGKIACVEIDNEKVCLKRFYKNENGVMLVSENPAYPPMNLNESNTYDVKILGLAVLKQSEIH
ncbi:MAG: S24 family peptidase [Dialister sp.]|nr:S24 family peptidase [Dialister sp.]